MLAFVTKNGYNHKFTLVLGAGIFMGESLIYSVPRENDELTLFGFSFFEKFRYEEMRYNTRKYFEPMIQFLSKTQRIGSK